MLSLTPPENFKPRFEVVGCFLEQSGKILMLHRQDGKPQENTWCIPAGKIKAGEDPVATIKREVREETGIVLPCDPQPVKTVYLTFAEYQFVYRLFRCTLDAEPEVELERSENKDYAWVTPPEALKLDLIEDEDACIKIAYGL